MNDSTAFMATPATMAMPAAVIITIDLRHALSRVRGREKKTETAKMATACSSSPAETARRIRHCHGDVPMAERMVTPAVHKPYVVHAAARERRLRRRRGIA